MTRKFSSSSSHVIGDPSHFSTFSIYRLERMYPSLAFTKKYFLLSVILLFLSCPCHVADFIPAFCMSALPTSNCCYAYNMITQMVEVKYCDHTPCQLYCDSSLECEWLSVALGLLV